MKASTLNLRRLFAHAVLGVLLLFGQSHATRHWLSHAIEATHAKAQGIPAETHCNACDGLVAFGASLPAPAAAPPLTLESAQAGPPTRNLSAPATAIATGYRSRAPPAIG